MTKMATFTTVFTTYVRPSIPRDLHDATSAAGSRFDFLATSVSGGDVVYTLNDLGGAEAGDIYRCQTV